MYAKFILVMKDGRRQELTYECTSVVRNGFDNHGVLLNNPDSVFHVFMGDESRTIECTPEHLQSCEMFLMGGNGRTVDSFYWSAAN